MTKVAIEAREDSGINARQIFQAVEEPPYKDQTVTDFENALHQVIEQNPATGVARSIFNEVDFSSWIIEALFAHKGFVLLDGLQNVSHCSIKARYERESLERAIESLQS